MSGLPKLFWRWDQIPPASPESVKQEPLLTAEERFRVALPILARQGWNVWGPYAQAHVETGGFKKIIGQNNFFGVIGRSEIPLVVRGVPTHEEVAGKEVPQDRDFGDWPTLLEALGWYGTHIQRAYPEAYLHRENPMVYFQYLGRWATEHTYPMILEARYKELLLDKTLSDRLRAIQGGSIS